MFDPIDQDDPLSQVGIDVCPECRTVLQDDGCRGCGWLKPVSLRTHVRPADGDELPSIGGW